MIAGEQDSGVLAAALRLERQTRSTGDGGKREAAYENFLRINYIVVATIDIGPDYEACQVIEPLPPSFEIIIG